MNLNRARYSVFSILLWVAISLVAQQNRLMYLIHDVPQSNFLNPAVPLKCKWYIGLPVLSSVHLNAANNLTSFNQAFSPIGNGIYQTSISQVEPLIHRRNYVGAELHVQLLGIGFATGDWSFLASVNEKVELAGTIPKSIVDLGMYGNRKFEGSEMSLLGTGLFETHYREYALSISKRFDNGLILGTRAKVLFGKSNVSTKPFDVAVLTDDLTFDLHLIGIATVRSSLPAYVNVVNDKPSDFVVQDLFDVKGYLMNKENLGLAFDFGVIYPLSEQIELSASVIDLGAISWQSNLHQYKGWGDFAYSGALGSNTSFNNLGNNFLDSLHLASNMDSYLTYLAPRVMAGATYNNQEKMTWGINTDLRIYRTKILSALTLSGQYQASDAVKLILGYTLQYNSFNNIGAGLVLGNHPVQFYIISDNVTSFIWPLSTRNVNLRFGFNLIPNCNRVKSENNKGLHSNGKPALPGNCSWVKEPRKRKRR